jgi:hypothetical protein
MHTSMKNDRTFGFFKIKIFCLQAPVNHVRRSLLDHNIWTKTWKDEQTDIETKRILLHAAFIANSVRGYIAPVYNARSFDFR